MNLPVLYDMGAHMKTTVEIAHALFKEAQAVAAREGTTLRALVNEGLRLALKTRTKRARFHMRKATFKGHGLQPGVDGGSWERIRELAYAGRGG